MQQDEEDRGEGEGVEPYEANEAHLRRGSRDGTVSGRPGRLLVRTGSNRKEILGIGSW